MSFHAGIRLTLHFLHGLSNKITITLSYHSYNSETLDFLILFFDNGASKPSSDTKLKSCCSTYSSGFTFSLKICSNTSLATVRFILPLLSAELILLGLQGQSRYPLLHLLFEVAHQFYYNPIGYFASTDFYCLK